MSFQPTWRDMDALGHVNNAVYSTWLENARDRWWQQVAGPYDRFPFILARTEIDFRRSVTWRDPLTLTLWVSRIGNSSFELSYTIDHASGRVADAKTVLVMVDFTTNTSIPISDVIRAKLTSYTR
jgi:acyl-CoA thioester hydrolase